MTAANTKWLRMDQPSDLRYAEFARQAEARGIHVDAIIQDWTSPHTPAGIAAEASAVVTALAPSGVHVYEVLNEQNNGLYTAAEYAAILRAVYPAVKAADPKATVLFGGLGVGRGLGSGYDAAAYLLDVYAAGGGGYFDAANFHPYSFPLLPSQQSLANPWSLLPVLRRLMGANGDAAKPIWITEFGCPTSPTGLYPGVCTDAQLGQQITNAYATARSATWKPGPLLVYDWQDDASCRDGCFGLYRADGTAKPAALAAFTGASES
ncbi:MAG TPA: hypothetical protein VKE97_01480 [Acidimicrobiia bacterium]|nr:hypothetical protein [Acidimicrobiia bacterium]